MKLFRHNKRKLKKGCGCKSCKPHKGIWAHFFNTKDRANAIFANKEIKQGSLGF